MSFAHATIASRHLSSRKPLGGWRLWLFASSGIESEIVADAEPIELLPSLTMGVARTGHLIALKLLARDDVSRPQDLVDLRALLRVASPPELERARDSLALIAARGYHRGRDLRAEMHTLLSLAP